jgi:hypothetical protein
VHGDGRVRDLRRDGPDERHRVHVHGHRDERGRHLGRVRPVGAGDPELRVRVHGSSRGKVFYVSASGFTSTGSACGTSCHYLEVAPGPWTKGEWCNLTTTAIPGVFSTSIGSGYENTRLMTIGGCTSGAGNLARATTRTVNGLTFSDWFLPSKDELQAVIELGGFAGENYWSSSQLNDTTNVKYAWIATQEFMNANDKSLLIFALPVRAF